MNSGRLVLDRVMTSELITAAGNITDEYKNLFQQLRLPWLNDLTTSPPREWPINMGFSVMKLFKGIFIIAVLLRILMLTTILVIAQDTKPR